MKISLLCLALATLVLPSCSYLGNLLNTPGRIINGTLGPVVPRIPISQAEDPMIPSALPHAPNLEEAVLANRSAVGSSRSIEI